MATATLTPRIRFDGVWKKFRRGEVHDSLRDLIPAMTRRLLGRTPSRSELQQSEFWAVEDISFDVGPGEAIGIIGPNGAGKSTILKLLTRILRPTRGRCDVRGRVGALIEIAAGFHADLTGRENVFLQGAILGMERAMIKRQFDEIVAFAELDEFIDTPVKRYSSGMNARLGFAIAAHLDPEVLIIDEVLSVGDYRFQQKAFDRIRALCTSGIPVALVSHQLDRIASLCSTAILLDRGRLVVQGAPSECIAAYVSGHTGEEATPQDDGVRVAVALEGEGPAALLSGEWMTLSVEAEVDTDLPDSVGGVSLRVRNLSNGYTVYAIDTDEHGAPRLAKGRLDLSVALQMNLGQGVYGIEAYVWDSEGRRALARSATVPVKISTEAGFLGSAQLNARLCSGAGATRRDSSPRADALSRP